MEYLLVPVEDIKHITMNATGDATATAVLEILTYRSGTADMMDVEIIPYHTHINNCKRLEDEV